MEQLIEKTISRNAYDKQTIVQVFLDADLRGSHNHLIELAQKKDLDLLELDPQETVIFINKKKTLMKCFVAGNTFSFTRRDRIDLEAIQYLPKAFGSKRGFEYDKALEISLNERLKRRERKN